VKFGRVRYKVLMMHSSNNGMQEFDITDRFGRRKSLRLSRKASQKNERKKERDRRLSMGSGVSLDNSERLATQINLPRFQSQATHFD
jgi:hypothetical protein